jgi:hypothetical protein
MGLQSANVDRRMAMAAMLHHGRKSQEIEIGDTIPVSCACGSAVIKAD